MIECIQFASALLFTSMFGWLAWESCVLVDEKKQAQRKTGKYYPDE